MRAPVLIQVITVVACIVNSAFSAAVGKLPPSMEKCNRKDSNFNKCLERATEKALKVLAKGYSPLGVFPFDPLDISAIDIKQGSGPVSIDLKFKNIKIKGLQDSKISNMKSDLKNLKFTSDVFVKKCVFDGKYSIKGKILILPINGEGNSHIVMENLKGALTIKGEMIKKNGENYAKVTNFDFSFNPTNFQIQLENLFNGDAALGKNMNAFLNENWQEIVKELKPAIEETFGMAFRDISNRLFSKVPFEDLFDNDS